MTQAEKARAFVVTLDTPGAAERMVRSVRQHWPSAPVIARAKDAEHARRLAGLGVEGVIPEAMEASLQLAARLLTVLGLPEEAVAARTDLTRERIRAAIERQAADEGH